MTMQAPTRITIEIHPGAAGAGDPPLVRVVPEAGIPGPQAAVAGQPRDEAPAPALFEPGPCLCLDDADCAVDHANE